MNDDELQRQLRGFHVPESSASARERARHRALLALGVDAAAPDSARNRPVWAWGALGAIVVVLLAVWIGAAHHTAPEDLAGDRKILQQMQLLFPGQVDAVVQENGKTSLSVAQSTVVGSDQPVVILFKQGTQTIRVLSYSGHSVCLALGGQESCFEILATAAGGVLLEGRNHVWNAADHPKIAGYSVRAQTLEESL